MALLEMRPRHKAVYLLLVICLMNIENRAINKDRADSLRAEQDRTKEEREKFQAIAEGLQKTLQQNAQQFDKTMRRSDAIIAGVSDSTKTQTGGDSFAYITFTPEPANVRFVPFPAPAVPWFLVSITSHGKYPLRDVRATMMDDDRRKAAVAEYNKHPDGDWIRTIQSADTIYQVPYLRPQSMEGPSGDVQLLGAYPIPEADSNRISIAFSSLNGLHPLTGFFGRCEELRDFLKEIWTGAVLLLHLFHGLCSWAKASDLGKFLLDGL